jgi:hypothetical protein
VITVGEEVAIVDAVLFRLAEINERRFPVRRPRRKTPNSIDIGAGETNQEQTVTGT